jgi:hypothetical protein
LKKSVKAFPLLTFPPSAIAGGSESIAAGTGAGAGDAIGAGAGVAIGVSIAGTDAALTFTPLGVVGFPFSIYFKFFCSFLF